MATNDSIQKAAAQMEASQKAFEAHLAGKGAGSGAGWSHDLVMQLSAGVLVFSAVLLIAGAILLARSRASPGEVVRLFGIVLIVTFSTVLVIVGYSNEQLTPIIGLFGAVAGYLLGKEPAAKTTAPTTPSPPHKS